MRDLWKSFPVAQGQLHSRLRLSSLQETFLERVEHVLGRMPKKPFSVPLFCGHIYVLLDHGFVCTVVSSVFK